ncbi:hypothetical protein GQ602_005977 [Ophiocordyceps camponoti-floridani]|uniref:Uncharacterized protein n=1 Tax=Ophiocordyceps camponoti-floridani TaxID=2030778 RepID=A0A8H4VBA4_9HYPO|nr:hypothetical protein GQ602_005977 [Ophiocordyceps camponoti-floridani]
MVERAAPSNPREDIQETSMSYVSSVRWMYTVDTCLLPRRELPCEPSKDGCESKQTDQRGVVVEAPANQSLRRQLG